MLPGVRVLLTGHGSDVGRLVKLDLLNAGHVIRLFGGSILDKDTVVRQVRHVDALVHVDFLDDFSSSSFPQLVSYNVGGTIHLAEAAEQREVPMAFWTPPSSGQAERTLKMAAQVAVDEYGAHRVKSLDDIVAWVERHG